MEQNNWLRGSVSIDEYAVSSKGIRHIRTTIVGKRTEDNSKPAADDPKPGKSDNKADKSE